jgi:uncharacterized protein YabE (DUF348 family)/3D (Asp-Asp-Asp) domain-containing protein
MTRSDDVETVLKLAGVDRLAGDVITMNDGGLLLERARPVVVEVDGRILSWRSRAETIEQVLAELDVEIGPYDGLLYNGVEANANDPLFPGPFVAIASSQVASFSRAYTDSGPINLTVTRAVPFTITEDGHSLEFKSAKPTVAIALREAGIRLGPGDEVYPDPATALTAGIEIQVDHADAISLQTGESVRVIYTHKDILGEALAEAGLSLGADDRVEPDISADVFNGMTARLVRVAGSQFIESDEIIHGTIFRPDNGLSGTQTSVVQGNDGTVHREYHIVIEDGVEVERTLVREWYDPQPNETVIYYSAASLNETGADTGSLNVARVERMYVTWYNAASSGKAASDPAYGITKSGVPLTKGIVAVDPKFIPLGTKVYVPGYGFGQALDTGGGIVGNMLDLGYPDGVEVGWHTGWVDVYILAP